MVASGENNLEAGLLSPDEKRALECPELATTSQTTDQKRKKRASRHLIVALILGVFVTLAIAAGPRIAACRRHHAAAESKALADLSLAQLATSSSPEVVRENHAVVHVVKRQADSNSTSEEPKPSETSKSDPTPTEDPTTEEPPKTPTKTTTKETTKETTTTEEPPKTPTTTAKEPPKTTTTTKPTPTPTDNNDDDKGTSSPDIPSTSSSKSTSSTRTTSSKPTTTNPTTTTKSTSPKSTSSTSKKPDSTTTTTDKKTTTSQTHSETTMTSTRPDGVVTTITSTSFYDVDPTQGSSNSGANDPGLQDDAAPKLALALFPAVMAVAGAFFVL